MKETKDYSLLRPFDEEAAKRGEAIIDTDGDKVRLVGVSSKGDEFCVELNDLGLMLASAKNLRMAPLTWVEGRPVYRGDVLYGKSNKEKYVAHEERAIPESAGFSSLHYDNSHDGFTWTPPKVKRTVKLLAWFDGICLFWRAEDDCNSRIWTRVPSEDKVIEIEEPAEVAK